MDPTPRVTSSSEGPDLPPGKSERPIPIESVRGATRVVSDFVAIASGRLTSAALSFITVLMTTRMLGPAGYGTVALVGIVSTLIFIVSTSWTGTSVRRYGREDLELRGTMNRLTWNRLLIGAPILLVSVTVVLVLKLLAALPGFLTWPLVAIALAIAMATIVADHWICLLETSGKMKVSAAGQVLSQVAYVSALVALFAAGSHVSATTILSLSLATTVLLTLGVAPIVWRVGVMPLAVDRQLLRRMLWLSVPVIGLTVSQYVVASVDIVVLRMFRTQAEVGVYAVAYQAYTVLSAAAVSATSVFVPLFVSLQLAGRRNLIVRYLESAFPPVLFVTAAAGGCAVALLPPLVPAVFGHAFAGAVRPLAVLAIGLVCLFGTYLVAPILTLHEQTRATAKINAVAAVINVVGDVVMIGVFHFGIIAPAAATSGALAFVFVAFFVRGTRLLESDFRIDLSIFTPLVAGIVPILALQGLLALACGVAASVAATAAVVTWRSPFRLEDSALIEKLELPPIVKRLLIRMTSLSM